MIPHSCFEFLRNECNSDVMAGTHEARDTHFKPFFLKCGLTVSAVLADDGKVSSSNTKVIRSGSPTSLCDGLSVIRFCFHFPWSFLVLCVVKHTFLDFIYSFASCVLQLWFTSCFILKDQPSCCCLSFYFHFLKSLSKPIPALIRQEVRHAMGQPHTVHL